MNLKSTCPICGEPNQCQMEKREQGSDCHNDSSCWCFQMPTSLDYSRLPVSLDEDQKRCICQKCWQRYSHKEQ